MFRRGFLIGVLLTSALVDLPRRVAVQTISASGVLTIVFTIFVGALLLRRPKLAWSGFIKVWPLSTLLFYSVLQCLWHLPSVQGFQNICVLWVFVGLIVLVLVEGKDELRSSDYGGLLLWATAFAALCYGVSVVYDGFGTESGIGARSFALYALLGLGLLLGRWVHGSRISFWLAASITLLVALSLSRTALVVGVLMFALACLRSFSSRNLRQAALIGGIAACGLYFLVVSTSALSTRFLGDSSVREFLSGNAEVDTSGRLVFWAATVDSFSRSPWLGQGAGTADDLIDSMFEGIGHPHNDYLRFLHDSGLLGLSMLLVGVAQLLILCRRAYRKSLERRSSFAGFSLGAFLALAAIVLTMITDNTASYLYVMAPLGILIGKTLSWLDGVAAAPSNSRASITAPDLPLDVISHGARS